MKKDLRLWRYSSDYGQIHKKGLTVQIKFRSLRKHWYIWRFVTVK